MLADPKPEPFAKGLLQLIKDPDLRNTLGLAAIKLVKEKYSIPAYRMKLNAAYDHLRETIHSSSESFT
ncbi:MAG TPA: hypothetical protein DD706_07125 [Nitrospiraceae bacterium]|nr:hypothetical protein [Nitrospiraceae bacterium]